MYELIKAISQILLSNIVQILIGCIISVLIHYCAPKRIIKSNLLFDLCLICLFSILGMLLPLNTYGMIPIFIGLLTVRFRLYTLLPVLISNALFNMQVPYTDVSFIWRTGMRRVILAFIIAIIVGIILRILKDKGEGLLKTDSIAKLGVRTKGLSGFAKNLKTYLDLFGIYLILGVIADTVFHKYILWELLDILNRSKYTNFIPKFFAGYNVVNPFFLLSVTIVFLLMNFIITSALLTILKLKGLFIYYLYFIIIAIILGTSAFL